MIERLVEAARNSGAECVHSATGFSRMIALVGVHLGVDYLHVGSCQRAFHRVA
jgi:hypothetical protein